MSVKRTAGEGFVAIHNVALVLRVAVRLPQPIGQHLLPFCDSIRKAAIVEAGPRSANL